MARNKGQIYSAEEKTKIVLELLKKEQTVSQLASKYKVTAKSITHWKKQFLENASKAFEDNASNKEQLQENSVDEIQKNIQIKRGNYAKKTKNNIFLFRIT